MFALILRNTVVGGDASQVPAWITELPELSLGPFGLLFGPISTFLFLLLKLN